MSEVDSLIAEERRLHPMGRWSRHFRDCPARYRKMTKDPVPCECGFDEAYMAEAEAVRDRDRLAALVEELVDWFHGADHHPGCSGATHHAPRCKCGRDRLADLLTEMEPVATPEEPNV